MSGGYCSLFLHHETHVARRERCLLGLFLVTSIFTIFVPILSNRENGTVLAPYTPFGESEATYLRLILMVR